MSRREYVLTKEQLAALLESSKPSPVMYLSGGQSLFPSPQENANRSWKKLADEMDEKLDRLCRDYARALALYEARDWSAAQEAFADIRRDRDADGPSLGMARRCAEFSGQGPPDAWDGVWNFDSK